MLTFVVTAPSLVEQILKEREVPESAKSRRAQSPGEREVPECAKMREGRRSELLRRLGLRAFRDFAPFGTSRSPGLRALWDSAPFGTYRIGVALVAGSAHRYCL